VTVELLAISIKGGRYKDLIEWAKPIQNLHFPLYFEGERYKTGVKEGRSPSKENIFPFPLIRGRG